MDAIMINPTVPQTTDTAMIEPFDSGLCGVEGCGGPSMGEVIVTSYLVNRVLFTPISTPGDGC